METTTESTKTTISTSMTDDYTKLMTVLQAMQYLGRKQVISLLGNSSKNQLLSLNAILIAVWEGKLTASGIQERFRGKARLLKRLQKHSKNSAIIKDNLVQNVSFVLAMCKEFLKSKSAAADTPADSEICLHASKFFNVTSKNKPCRNQKRKLPSDNNNKPGPLSGIAEAFASNLDFCNKCETVNTVSA